MGGYQEERNDQEREETSDGVEEDPQVNRQYVQKNKAMKAWVLQSDCAI